MKDIINKYIEDHKQETINLGRELFANPELGFKEFKTRQIIEKYLNEHGLKINKEFAYTGFSVSIGSGKPHIGLIAELDAIPTVGHPYANKEDNAAHACGHSTQCTLMLAALDALNQNIKNLDGTITLFFTPAEEFTDIEYRKKLISEGTIKYPSGKQNMIYEHVIDDVDMFIHIHGSGQYVDHHFSVGSSLTGFVYKKYIFKGVGSHAAIAPWQGINALNMCTLFLNGLAMLRETFKEEDMVRVHGMIDKGGQTVNSIPEVVEYECYLRSINPEFLQTLADKVDNMAICCAKAFGGDVKIDTIPGYLPLIQDKNLNEIIKENILNFTTIDDIKFKEVSVAAGDVGDMCVFKPVIQFGHTGFVGRMHGNNLMIADENEVYITQAKIVADSVYDLLVNKESTENIIKSFTPKMTYQQYIDYLNK